MRDDNKLRCTCFDPETWGHNYFCPVMIAARGERLVCGEPDESVPDSWKRHNAERK